MIEHLHDREKKLEPFGWTGREAEWIALVCLHSGLFTRAQFCFYFEGARRKRAWRFVHELVESGLAVEYALPKHPGGARVCRIFHKPLYRALGIENVRHRREAEDGLMLRRLLSLDYVLEHPELPWLPTEPEKVGFFELLGIERKLLPYRVYQGAVRKQKPLLRPETAHRGRCPNRHLRLRRSGQRYRHRTAILGSGSPATLGRLTEERSSGPRPRNWGGP